MTKREILKKMTELIDEYEGGDISRDADAHISKKFYRLIKYLRNNWAILTDTTVVKNKPKRINTAFATEVFNHWNSMKIIKHKPDSKRTEKAMKILNSMARNKKYTKEEVINSISTYKELILNSPRFQSRKKIGWIVTLPVFLSGYSLTELERINSKELRNIDCWMIECLNRQKAIKKWGGSSKVENPYTSLIQIKYCNNNRLDVRSMGTKEYGYFERSGKKLEAFIVANPTVRVNGNSEWVDILFKAISDRIGGKPIVFGNLTSNLTFSDILPRYVKENLVSRTSNAMARKNEELQRRNLIK